MIESPRRFIRLTCSQENHTRTQHNLQIGFTHFLLTFYSSDSYELIGVVSWGIGCGLSAYPDVYARVTDVMDWIELITKATTTASKQNCPKHH